MTTPARHLRPVNTTWQDSDPVLAALRAARARRDQADRDIRILLAYARELTTPRPYRLADLAEATGKSISGVRTAYTAPTSTPPGASCTTSATLTTPLSAPGTAAMTYATRPAACASGVNKPLTPKRRYRVVENDEYAAFLRRVIRAYSRRVAAGDIEAITTMAALADHLEDATRQAITGLRGFGYSWADIAMRLGITRQGAQQRWGDTPEPVTDPSSTRATEAARDPTRPDAGSHARNPHGSGHGGEHRTRAAGTSVCADRATPPRASLPGILLLPALRTALPVHRRARLRRAAPRRLRRLARSRLARRRLHPPGPAARRHQATSTPPPANSCAPSPRSACPTGRSTRRAATGASPSAPAAPRPTAATPTTSSAPG